jgi:hypothetical protein
MSSISERPQTNSKTKAAILTVGLALLIITLWQWYSAYLLFSIYAAYPGGSKLYIWDVLIAVLFSMATFMFLGRKKAGWILSGILLTHLLINSLALFAASLYIGRLGSLWVSGRPVYTTTPFMHFVIFAFFGVALWLLSAFLYFGGVGRLL